METSFTKTIYYMATDILKIPNQTFLAKNDSSAFFVKIVDWLWYFKNLSKIVVAVKNSIGRTL